MRPGTKVTASATASPFAVSSRVLTCTRTPPGTLWGSRKYRPLRLGKRQVYRLDYFEVHPELRGGLLGVFALAVIASRALELGCDGMVLASLPGATKFYAEAGGIEGPVDGWKAARSLVPFTFERPALESLREKSDEFIIEG